MIKILLSTYNGAEYLGRQLDSIIEQENVSDEMEVIVRDDGSVDGTRHILNSYRDKIKIKLICGRNIGCAASFHELIKIAGEADYYAFSDQDDVWLKDKISSALKYMNHDVPVLYGSNYTIVDENLNSMHVKGRPYVDNKYDILIKGCTIPGCTMMFNKELRDIYLSCVDKNIDFKNLYHDFWMLKLATLVGQVVYDENSHILYRQHGSNVMGIKVDEDNMWLYRLKNFDYTLKKYKSRSDATNYSKALLKCYNAYIKNDDRALLMYISNARENVLYRIKLLKMARLSLKPIYERLAYQCFIALGWI